MARSATDNDFVVPKGMKKLSGTNLGRNKHFDQIGFHDPQRRLRTSRAGIISGTIRRPPRQAP